MGSFSIWHWIVTIVIFVSPVMGIIRGVKNSSIGNAIASAFLPLYGMVYFFAARR